MTDRWSNPSGSLGVDRFRVWPAGTDSYSHSDLATNWDTLDGIIGIPSSGVWPPTTGINGGIYAQVKILQDELFPIGAVVPWFRPSASIAIPTFWHACDGTTLTSGQHAFPGIAGSVALPDLRNSFILGADATLAIGAAAAAVGSPSIDTAAGAPGESATGGDNQSALSVANMPSHNHTFTGNALGVHGHIFSGSAMAPHDHADSIDFGDTSITGTNDFTGGGTKKGISDIAGLTGATDFYTSLFPHTSSDSAGTPSGSISTAGAGTPSGSISSAGSGTQFDNRPRWTGLIFICKVLYATTP